MNKRLLHSTCALLVAFNVALGWRVYTAFGAADAGPSSQSQDSGYTSMALFARILQTIRKDYVDEKKVSYEALTQAALKGMLSSLDPHSQFMDSREFKGMQDDTHSRFGGLGLHVSVRDNSLIIVSPMEGTPGFRAGLQPGDQIIKIDQKPTEKMDLSDAMGLLRGEIGQRITLTVFRPATKDITDYALVRESINVPSVKDSQILPQTLDSTKIGYVRITQFNVPTNDEFAAKLDELQKQGMEALILDLRYNPGGLLESAVNVAGQFLPPRTLVVSTEGRNASQSKVYRTSESNKARPNYPIAILINGGSASGSEIVAGALKDLNRAILVGETTFGKGSVQSVIGLQDGSALRLTTAKYYTPSKQVIHEKGVTPNIVATMTPEQDRMLLLRRRDEVPNESDKKELESFEDTQLQRAMDALRGVMIYREKNAVKAAQVDWPRAK